MNHRPLLPGMRGALRNVPRPIDEEDTTRSSTLSVEEAQRIILEALAAGPLSGWKVRDATHLSLTRVNLELSHLRKAGRIHLQGTGTRNWAYHLGPKTPRPVVPARSGPTFASGRPRLGPLPRPLLERYADMFGRKA